MTTSRIPLATALLLGLTSLAARAQTTWPDETALQDTLGRKALRIENEHALAFYQWRKDVPILWQGAPIEIFEGMTQRYTFQRDGETCHVYGNAMLFVDETMAFVSELAAQGMHVTSLVPRFPGALPQPFQLRFHGQGDERQLAMAIQAARTRLDAIRADAPTPLDALPFARVALSDVHEIPLEDLFHQKAEVKDGVVLFRFEGPQGPAGNEGRRLGVAVHAAFAGNDEDARVRIDWTLESERLAPVLRTMSEKGFALESLCIAVPGRNDLFQIVLLGKGKAIDLATALHAGLGIVATTPVPFASEASFQRSDLGIETLGLAHGELAPGWKSDATHPAGPRRATWQIETEERHDVLRMTDAADQDGRTFNLFWNDAPQLANGKLTLRMRADRGREDQGGGPIWRVQDADNYYIARFNPLEQDFRVYRVVDGKREQLQAYGDLPYRSHEWFTIEVVQRGNHIVCTLNDDVRLEVDDDTFQGAGGVGVWSKADSQPSLGGLWIQTH